jgi:hypothetical protein
LERYGEITIDGKRDRGDVAELCAAAVSLDPRRSRLFVDPLKLL